MSKTSSLHPKNKNRDRYDMPSLVSAHKPLQDLVFENKYGDLTIDFSDPVAVKALNKALLSFYYGIENWDFPDENLCPPIPGRADYLHYLADLIGEGKKKILDVGCGATCIYPIIGVVEYGWEFVGSDIDKDSLVHAKQIVDANDVLKDKVKFIHQPDFRHFFKDIIGADDHFDAVMCNPPFHKSIDNAKAISAQKVSNLKKQRTENVVMNFSGKASELSYQGGEYNFVNSMIYESKVYAQNVTWFTSLVSRKENLNGLYVQLGKMNVKDHKVIDMGTGNKKTRILAWTF